MCKQKHLCCKADKIVKQIEYPKVVELCVKGSKYKSYFELFVLQGYFFRKYLSNSQSDMYVSISIFATSNTVKYVITHSIVISLPLLIVWLCICRPYYENELWVGWGHHNKAKLIIFCDQDSQPQNPIWSIAWWYLGTTDDTTTININNCIILGRQDNFELGYNEAVTVNIDKQDCNDLSLINNLRHKNWYIYLHNFVAKKRNLNIKNSNDDGLINKTSLNRYERVVKAHYSDVNKQWMHQDWIPYCDKCLIIQRCCITNDENDKGGKMRIHYVECENIPLLFNDAPIELKFFDNNKSTTLKYYLLHMYGLIFTISVILSFTFDIISLVNSLEYSSSWNNYQCFCFIISNSSNMKRTVILGMTVGASVSNRAYIAQQKLYFICKLFGYCWIVLSFAMMFASISPFITHILPISVVYICPAIIIAAIIIRCAMLCFDWCSADRIHLTTTSPTCFTQVLALIHQFLRWHQESKTNILINDDFIAGKSKHCLINFDSLSKNVDVFANSGKNTSLWNYSYLVVVFYWFWLVLMSISIRFYASGDWWQAITMTYNERNAHQFINDKLSDWTTIVQLFLWFV